MTKTGKRSNDEADNYSTRARKPRLSKSTRQSAQLGDVPDSEEDPGHSTSAKFLAAAKEPAKRGHTAVSNLRNAVEEGGKRLATLLEKKALGVKRRDRELKDTFIKFILDAHRDQSEMVERGDKQPPTSKRTASAIYQSAKSNIASSQKLLGHYERASQQVAFGQRARMKVSGWEKDSQTLHRILNKQGEKIKYEIHLLIGDPTLSKGQVKGDISELDIDLWNRFVVGEANEEIVKALDGRKEKTWASVVNNAQRGVRRTVKDLPEDDE